MKKSIIILMFLIGSATIFAQETALEKVAKETCEYFQENKDELTKLSSNERVTKLGLQIFVLYDKYKDELKKEGIEVELSNDSSAEDFGEKVGLKMVTFCSDILMSIAEDVGDDEEDAEYAVEGELSSITGDEISKVSLKDSKGKTQKFIWLNNFEGSDELINTESIKGLRVKISYKNVEIYSPKLKEYIVKKQISKIEYLD